jgi:hypothetical protein
MLILNLFNKFNLYNFSNIILYFCDKIRAKLFKIWFVRIKLCDISPNKCQDLNNYIKKKECDVNKM